MSSPHSSSHSAPAELLTLLPAVMAEVAEHAFFAWAAPCGERDFADLVAAKDPPHAVPAGSAAWLRARVSFRGVVAGSLEIQLPVELARELGVALTGGAATDGLTDQEMGDVAGELANMLCGVLLTRIDRRQAFELRPPQVARMAGVGDGDGPDADQFFCVNDYPVAVRFGAWEP
ncbi:MAG: chemotaxis protein CheX [Vicinamibacterales bacterium]